MSTVVKDLGAVTAYADAVAAGYTGTKEEWQTLMASYASVAEEAQEAKEGAEAAQEAAEDARDAAIDAKEGAENAVDGFGAVVTQATNQAVQTVRAEGTTQVGNVSSEGTTQVAAVQAKGTEVIQSIPADYTQLSSDVTQLKEDLTDVQDVLEIPYNASVTKAVAYASATYIDGITFKANKSYTITSSIPSAVGAIYVFGWDANDSQIFTAHITGGNTENAIVFTPTETLIGCRITARVTSVSLAGTMVTISVAEDSVSVIEKLGDDVEGLGETIDTITGYTKPNLFNNTIKSVTANGVTFTVNADKSVTITGTATALSAPNAKCTLPQGDYLLSGCNGGTSQSYHIMLVRANGSIKYQYGGADVDFSITDPEETVTLYCRVTNGTTINDTMYPMIRPASVYNPTYVPYGVYQVYKPIQQLIDYTQFNWSGKKMNVIGDSIVKGDYGNFVKVIRDILCLSEARNYGVGGSCLASSSADSQYPPSVLRYENMDLDAQIIVVHAGTNDYSAQIPLGDTDSTDITTFNGALNTMMNGLREMYPTALIIFDSILHRYNDNALTIKASEYRQCIEDRCLANHIVFYDAYKYTGFDFVKGYYDHILTSDGLHPNQTGANILGRKLAGFINWN